MNQKVASTTTTGNFLSGKGGGDRGGWAGQQAGIFKVRYGLGEGEGEIERHRNKET
jgi:hypothetical protein